ncbi:TIGR02594 family protein [Bradyrhizobium sp. 200]|uniref:TIGR02594 family protein n=1 Tax=Bradyrhizobium sp. 200 TaxID=2782665 RepID=UPI001FFF66D5|nr:TIGR02594 family protein [Bradyrhizobium sp. 200]UPJ49494.1 TIGR02594 family protein [Bradyrhizobium sp. 200]
MARVIDVLRQVAPKASPGYLAAFDSGDALLQQHQITTPDRLAHFLAQVLHESGGLTLEHESMNYGAERLLQIFGAGRHSAAITPPEAQRLARDERGIAERVYGLGNPRKAQELSNKNPGDGFKYRGRGLMQTTGRCNYRRMGQACGVDFEENPDLVFSPQHALKPALVEWSEAGLNVYADNNDILAISRAINCGSPKSKAIPNGMQDRATWFAKVRSLVDHIDFGTATTAEIKPTMTQATGVPRSEPGSESAIAGLLGEQILRVGDEGPLVRAVQLALARLGYPLRGSASFADRTLSAVNDFQKAHGLEVDGEVGQETATAIDRALEALKQPAALSPQVDPGRRPSSANIPVVVARPAQPAAIGRLAELVGNTVLGLGDQGSAVKALQLALAKLGYGLRGTGYFGGATEAAVMDFQERYSLEVDGEVGAETAQALDQVVAGPPRSAQPSQGQQPAPGTDARPLWVIEGLKWLNLREGQGAAENADILDWARGEGGAIARDYKHDSIPWCALFANMVLTKVGIKGTETLWALDWDKWGQKLPGPAVGAFAPMKREGGGHIAIVVGRDTHGNLMCLGGNQSDTVSIIPFPIDRPRSFRWPVGVSAPFKAGLEFLPVMRSDGRVSTKES